MDPNATIKSRKFAVIFGSLLLLLMFLGTAFFAYRGNQARERQAYESLQRFLERLHANAYERASANAAFASLKIENPTVRDALHVRMVRVIAEQELHALDESAPSVSDLIRFRDFTRTTVFDYKAPDWSTSVAVTDFPDWDKLVAKATSDIASFDEFFPTATRIIVEGTVVVFYRTASYANANGSTIESSMSAKMPLEWILKYHPQVIGQGNNPEI